MKQLNFFAKSIILLITFSFTSCKKDVENRLENTTWDAVMTSQNKSASSITYYGETYEDNEEEAEVVNCKITFLEDGTGLMTSDKSTSSFSWSSNDNKTVTLNFMGQSLPFKVVTNEKNRQEWKYQAVIGSETDEEYEYSYSSIMSVDIKLTR